MEQPKNIVRQLSRRLFWIMLAMIGSMSVATLILNPVARAQSPDAGSSWTFTGSLSANRVGHTATLLPNGKVLVVGGGGFPCSSGFCYATVNGSAELYDPAAGTWSYTGSLIQRRNGHSATLLQNGQVLVAGGNNYGYDIGYFASLNSAELYDPATGKWRPTGSFNRIQDSNSATLPSNGKVLAVGYDNNRPRGIVAELYDPATGTWSNTSSPSFEGFTISLPNGKVLIMDGYLAELYDPATEKWTRAVTGDSATTIDGVNTATMLPNGKILVTGPDFHNYNVFLAELYDPATGTWSRTGDPKTVGGGKAILLPSGQVLVAGGQTCSNVECISQNLSELYDPATGTWTLTSQLNTARAGHIAVLLPNGKVLVAGGIDGDFGDIPPRFLSSAELYDPGINLIPNQIDDAQFFVRQQYRDFLNREPDADGLAFWTNEITSCGGEAQCVEAKRINVSAAYFLSIEFQQTGYLVYRFYKTSYGNLPGAPVPINLSEFLPDTQKIRQGVIVNQGGWQQTLENNKEAFTKEFVQRSRFLASYPITMTEEEFVDMLKSNVGGALSQSERDQLVRDLAFGVKTRAQVLRAVAEDPDLVNAEFNRAFVLMQYFGYLRRNPNDAPDGNFDGYNFWLNKLNQFNGDFVQAEMVRSFLVSGEYRRRFGP